MHAGEIDPETQAALLRLDPIGDREEYAALAALLASHTPPSFEELAGSEHPEARRLDLRIRNLGVDPLLCGHPVSRVRSWTQSMIPASGAS